MREAPFARLARVALFTAALALVVAGCDDATQSSSTNAVAYDVLETMRTNTCGPQSMPLLRMLQYRATISVRGARMVWGVPASGIEAAGQYVQGTREFRVAAESYVTLREADRVTGRAACVLRRFDVIDGVLSADPPAADADGGLDGGAVADGSVLDAGGAQWVPVDAGLADAGLADAGDAGATVRTFSATETIVYGPVEGADCTDAVGAGDGQYSTLPCEIDYDVAGGPEAQE